jgi:hypothetical protein
MDDLSSLSVAELVERLEAREDELASSKKSANKLAKALVRQVGARPAWRMGGMHDAIHGNARALEP